MAETPLTTRCPSARPYPDSEPCHEETPAVDRLILALGLAAPMSAQTTAAPKTEKEKLGYALGMDVARRSRARRSISTRRCSAPPCTRFAHRRQDGDDHDDQATLTELRGQDARQGRPRRAGRRAGVGPKPLPDKNKATGAAFLAANKAKAGVQDPARRLAVQGADRRQRRIAQADRHRDREIRGTLIDGTEFDAPTSTAARRASRWTA